MRLRNCCDKRFRIASRRGRNECAEQIVMKTIRLYCHSYRISTFNISRATARVEAGPEQSVLTIALFHNFSLSLLCPFVLSRGHSGPWSAVLPSRLDSAALCPAVAPSPHRITLPYHQWVLDYSFLYRNPLFVSEIDLIRTF